MKRNRLRNDLDSDALDATVRRVPDSDPETDDSDSEDVKELLEDGQYFEAAAVAGIENAPPADVAEVRTRQFAENDVPEEYLEEDEPPR